MQMKKREKILMFRPQVYDYGMLAGKQIKYSKLENMNSIT